MSDLDPRYEVQCPSCGEKWELPEYVTACAIACPCGAVLHVVREKDQIFAVKAHFIKEGEGA